MRVDKLSLVFGYVFHLAAFLGAIYALHVRDRVQHSAGTLYAGSSIGALFSGDLITLFVFWELTAITSVFLILARRTGRAQATAIPLSGHSDPFGNAAARRHTGLDVP